MIYSVWLMCGLDNRTITHWRCLSDLKSLTVLEAESPCWLLNHLMPLNMTGRSPWEATANSCESWQQLLQHEYHSTRN